MRLLDVEEYVRWMRAARATLESALGDLERGDYNWACFKAQQAAELAVKGLYRGLGEVAVGRSVSRLLASAPSRLGVEAPGRVVECALLLDKMYIPTRYPDAWSEGSPHEYYTEGEAREAVECARLVLEWVEEVWTRLSRGEGGGG